MELCEKFCNAGISRHQGHGTWGTWGRGVTKENLINCCCELNCILLKEMLKSSPLEPVNVSILDNRVFADIIKMYIKIRSYQSRVGP